MGQFDTLVYHYQRSFDVIAIIIGPRTYVCIDANWLRSIEFKLAQNLLIQVQLPLCLCYQFQGLDLVVGHGDGGDGVGIRHGVAVDVEVLVNEEERELNRIRIRTFQCYSNFFIPFSPS